MGRRVKLSPTMIRMLISVRDHGDYKRGLRGRSEHGAADGTLYALIRRELIVWRNEPAGKRGYEITEAGRLAVRSSR